MSRIGMRTGIALAAAVAAGLGCSAAAPVSQDPVSNGPAADTTGPADPTTPVADSAAAPASPGEPVCLPLAVCGCFNERRCVTARVQADGISVDILDGEHAGETGHLLQDCPTEGDAPADCVSYVDPAMICRSLRPAGDNAAKYLCSMDDIHLDYRCGFVDGACTAQ